MEPEVCAAQIPASCRDMLPIRDRVSVALDRGSLGGLIQRTMTVGFGNGFN